MELEVAVDVLDLILTSSVRVELVIAQLSWHNSYAYAVDLKENSEEMPGQNTM